MKLSRLLFLVLLAVTGVAAIAGQRKPVSQKAERVPLDSTAVKLDRLDPAIDQIVPKEAKLERIATGFKWVEGPVWIEGSLYFAEIPSNTIRKWTPGYGVRTVLASTGFQGMRPYGGPEPGSNGMTLDSKGRLTIAGHAQRDVYRIDSPYMRGPWTVLPRTTLVDSYQGKKLNSPNDLVYRSDGSLYFTDPPYGLRTQKDSDPEKELKVNGVYRLTLADGQKESPNSALQLLVSDLPRPNGIAFSPDEKYLYVDNSEPKKIWMRYRVQPDGSLTDAKLFYDATSDTRPGSPDGMKVDENGNVYSTGPGGVWIFSPEGKPLGTIVMPEKSANVAWGGPDRKTLYITASTSIYRIHLEIAGAPLIRSK